MVRQCYDWFQERRFNLPDYNDAIRECDDSGGYCSLFKLLLIVLLVAHAGIPLVYELDESLKPVKHYYLASDEEVKAAQEKVANQGKAK